MPTIGRVSALQVSADTSPSTTSRSRRSCARSTNAEVGAILAANPRPSPQHGIVPAEAEAVLDQLCAYGTPRQVRARLEVWDGAADIVMIGLPPGLSWPHIEAILRAAAP